MTHPDEKTARDFLLELEAHLRIGTHAYKQYLENGRSFRHARVLKENNLQISTLIEAHADVLPAEQQLHIQALDHHLDVWHALWDELDRCKAHAPDEVFVFENSVNFPRPAVAALLDYLARLTANSKDA